VKKSKQQIFEDEWSIIIHKPQNTLHWNSAMVPLICQETIVSKVLNYKDNMQRWKQEQHMQPEFIPLYNSVTVV
jgi:23S rRNA-/tRNA-specific pseudouridylate synthase